MIAIRIPDTRKLMSDLLSRDVFDTFLLGEAQITTYTTFRIDGTWHEDYFKESPQKAASVQSQRQNAAGNDAGRAGLFSADLDKHEPSPARPQEPTWKRVRPIVLDIVRGKHSPLSFRIILKLNDRAIAGVLKSSGAPYTPDQVDGLFMNICYQMGEITCTSGTSMKTFTLDKSLDHAWDDMMLKFFASRGIEVEKL